MEIFMKYILIFTLSKQQEGGGIQKETRCGPNLTRGIYRISK